ncbi:hypothetical protein C2S52_008200 [Perilla frutescens var. hirtella]|nr:hypothetical protein C2S52_008200 [Perilla frutescens var. hirtella]
MEGHSRKEEGCHQFLDLIPKERELHEKIHGFSEEKRLELRLAPPGEDWTNNNNSNSSRLGQFSDSHCAKNPVLKSSWQQQASSHFLHLQSQPCSNRAATDLKISEKNTFSPANPAVPNSSSAQKRTAPAPVVGWPPIRSFRKNLATGSGSSSKLASDSGDVVKNKTLSESKPKENCMKTMFVKINMDGIPIGRKVDLKAYDSYENPNFFCIPKMILNMAVSCKRVITFLSYIILAVF